MRFNKDQVRTEKYQIPPENDIYWRDDGWVDANNAGPTMVLRIVNPYLVVATIGHDKSIYAIYRGQDQIMINPTAEGGARFPKIDFNLLKKYKINFGDKLKE